MITMKPKRVIEKLNSLFTPKFKKENVILFLLIFSVFLVFSFILYFLSIKNQINIKVGEQAPYDIVASTSYVYVDQEKTEQKKEEIKKSISPLYTLNTNTELEVINSIEDFFNKVMGITSRKISLEEKVVQIIDPLEVSDTYAKILAKFNQTQLTKIKNFVINELNNFYKIGIREENIKDVISDIQKSTQFLAFNDDEKIITTYVVDRFIKPNLVIDVNATNMAIEEALKNTKPVQVVIPEGSKIIEKGKIITEDDIKLLQTLGLYKNFSLVDAFILVLLSVLESTLIYLAVSKKKKKLTKLLEIFTIILPVSLISFYLSQISLYLIPLPLVALIAIEFFDIKETALIILSFTLLIVNNINVFNLILLFYLVISILMALFEEKEKKISQYLLIDLFASLFVFLVVLLINLSFKIDLQLVLNNALYVIFMFALTAPVAMVFSYVMEYLFNEAVFLRLIDLSDLNAPLLKEMSNIAPGTFSHSLMVAAIASKAAEEIGANSLLTRTGALYHDIGKMLYPYYFTENQVNLPNIHNTISPNLSKVIIINHVKDGVELGKSNRLPDDIINFIKTHHGTSVISYFYHKAKETDPNVSEDSFRYPGPKPDTKETAIVALADSIEAASKSLENEKFDLRSIEELVERLVKDKVDDGELSESTITLKELEIIKQSFIKSLLSLYHRREKYPQDEHKS